MRGEGWATEEHLVDVGAAVLRERGVDGFSLREVARRAGVSAAAVYRHFADKDALLRDIADGTYQELLRALVSAASHRTPRARLESAVNALLRFAYEHPDEQRALLSTPRTDDTLHLLTDRTREMTTPAQARPLAFALYAHAFGVAALRRAGKLREVGEFDRFWRQSVERIVSAFQK